MNDEQRDDTQPLGVRDPQVVDYLKKMWEQRTVQRVEGEGLRDRKKRILRQQISDTATLMFLQRGFDEVKVSEVADECGVSEKTVYNYFPTKESLLFDREEGLSDELADAFSDPDTKQSLVEIALDILTQDVDSTFDAWLDSKEEAEAAMIVVRQFGEMIERTPALQAAQQAMGQRLTDVIAHALARRAGVDPEEPEPQMAAAILMGLWRIQFGAMHRLASAGRSMEQMRTGVLDELHRAARVADAGLSSINLVMQRTSTKQQVQEAAEAANEARKQVIAAMKQARDAWKQVAIEARAFHELEEEKDRLKREQRAARRALRESIRAHQMQQREQHLAMHQQHAEIRERQAEIRERQAQMQAARRQKRRPPQG